MTGTLVPIFICVVLPVSIVLIASLTKINSENKRAQIIIKAIEANKDVDTDKIIESLKEPEKSALQVLNKRLLCGCICSFIGVGLATVGIFNLAHGAEFASDPVTIPLLLSGLSLAIGISYLIVYFVSKKQIKDGQNDDDQSVTEQA